MDEFEAYRPLLFSIAYRMLGSASEAEDMVQETYLRYRDADTAAVRTPKSYLTTIVVNLCLDHLKSARLAREQYIGAWLPEPVLTSDPDLLPQAKVEQDESISLAFLVLLERLTPPERAVFLLHEVFDYPFQEIATILDKNTAHCRQLFHRARGHLADQRQRFATTPETHRRLLERFASASRQGNVAALTELLTDDVVTWSDGGGKVRAGMRPILGRAPVTRLFLHIGPAMPANYRMSIEEVNGAPALLLFDGPRLHMVVSLDIANERIQIVRVLLNPDKLAFLQQQLARP